MGRSKRAGQKRQAMQRTFKKKSVTRLGLIECQLANALHRFDYNNKDHTMLAYIYLYGKEARNKIVEDKLSKSRGSIDNYISKYRLDGVVVGTGGETRLNPEILIINEPFIQTIQYEIT